MLNVRTGTGFEKRRRKIRANSRPPPRARKRDCVPTFEPKLSKLFYEGKGGDSYRVFCALLMNGLEVSSRKCWACWTRVDGAGDSGFERKGESSRPRTVS